MEQNAFEDRFNFRTHFAFSRPPLVSGIWVALSALATLAVQRADTPAASDRFIDFGAKSNAAIAESGEWYRLLTGNFIHADWLHFFFNAVIIFNIGGIMENLYRRREALVVLLATALATTTASVMLSPHLALGGSGVAIGCLACTTVFALRFYSLIKPRHRALILLVVLPLMLAYLYLGFSSTGVDNAGHLGGATLGVIFGLWLEPRLLAKTTPRFPLGAAPITGLLIAIAWLSLEHASVVRWVPVYGSDELYIELPDTFSLFSRGPRHLAFENELGTTVVLESLPLEEDESVASHAMTYRAHDLERFIEAEDIEDVRVDDPESGIL